MYGVRLVVAADDEEDFAGLEGEVAEVLVLIPTDRPDGRADGSSQRGTPQRGRAGKCEDAADTGDPDTRCGEGSNRMACESAEWGPGLDSDLGVAQHLGVRVLFEVDRVVVVNDHTEMFAAETHGAQTLDSTLCGGSVGKDRGDVIVAQMGVELLGVNLCYSRGKRLTSMVHDGSTSVPPACEHVTLDPEDGSGRWLRSSV